MGITNQGFEGKIKEKEKNEGIQVVSVRKSGDLGELGEGMDMTKIHSMTFS